MLKITGEIIGNTSTSLKGLNTHGDDSNNIISTICGVPDHVSRFISVTSVTSRYIGEVGDVIVGRVRELTGNRWKVDIGAYQDGIILLSNVTEPGGILRRRGRADELHMRNIFSEGDVIVCEVQKIFGSGTVSLHTRNTDKHGKMNDGFMLCTSPILIPRTKKHFHQLCINSAVRVVIGVNGYIWVDCTGEGDHDEDLARVHNAITILNRCGRMVSIDDIERIVLIAQKADISPYGMLSSSLFSLSRLSTILT